ncbi:MAG: hypothetical protein R3F19_11220 [Verrucomicrobiales bacterium]
MLTSIEKTLGLARSMTYGVNPIVKLVKKLYQNGVTLTDKALAKEEKIERLATLEDWFLNHLARPANGVICIFSASPGFEATDYTTLS